MFYKIINLIKINLILKNSIIKTKLLNSDFKILNIFIKLNIIKHVKLIKKNEFLITLNNNTGFKNFKNLYKPSNPIKIKLRNIINNNKNNKNIYYISTPKGVINNIEAENSRTGGFLIIKIT